MWTRGPDKEIPGKFAYELWDERALVERVGGFDTHTEADRAAEQAQRGLLFRPVAGEPEMSIEEILVELSEGFA